MILTARCTFVFDCTDGYYNMPKSTPPLQLLSKPSHCSCFSRAFIAYNNVWIEKLDRISKSRQVWVAFLSKPHVCQISLNIWEQWASWKCSCPQTTQRSNETVAHVLFFFNQSDHCKKLFQASCPFVRCQLIHHIFSRSLTVLWGSRCQRHNKHLSVKLDI